MTRVLSPAPISPWFRTNATLWIGNPIHASTNAPQPASITSWEGVNRRSMVQGKQIMGMARMAMRAAVMMTMSIPQR